MPNPVKERLRQGLPAIGTWLSIPSPVVAEALAGLEPDWLLIDTEHGAIDEQTVEEMIRAIRAASSTVVPLVRVAANDPALIKKALDRGAMGVLVPLVNSAEEARRAVAACRYPPDGIRGVAGTRASRYGLDMDRYFASWNREVLVGVQVETPAALEAVEAIASTPGVDLLFIGPNDLSAGLGLFRQWEHPHYRAAVARILDAAKAAGIAAGYMARGPEEAQRRVREGFALVSVTTDLGLLLQAASGAFEQARGPAR
ncbi:MAG: hypothetical protein IMX02_08875 [Limnochordaceae bacterium]|nr:hypothetical protein [Limnochordaceae bacterium]